MKTRCIAFFGMFFLIGLICWAQPLNTSPFRLRSVATTSFNITPTLFETSGVFPLPNTLPIFGLSVSGHIVFKHENNSMVRITVECMSGTEYLVYETHPLLTDMQEFDIRDISMETAILQAETPIKLKIIILNAVFLLQDVNYASSATERALRARQSVQKEQENAIIENLNEHLEKRGMLWRAGNTSISELSYEQKKAVFGDSVPYLGGFEYYIGGVFVAPGYNPQDTNRIRSTINDNYVKEWDWRNRHGKNWMTSVKDQGACNSCSIFALLGTIEAYANLYYNRGVDLDLAEQELLCASVVPICITGSSFEYVYQLLTRNGGVMEESCFPYVHQKPPCDQCNNPTENINVDSVDIFGSTSQEDIKRRLFKSPIAISSDKAWHGVVLAGYKRLDVGDEISYPNRSQNWDFEYLTPDSPLVGSTAWLIKNSWGNWGENGYCLMVEDIGNVNKNKAEIIGKVHSLKYTDKDIVVEDADGDGFYFWGVGKRPSFLPNWIPAEPDGNDSDPTKGPLDDFGNLKTIKPTNFPYEIHIINSTLWSSFDYCLPTVYVESGATLTITGNICLNRNSRIFVKNGGVLVLNGASLTQASIKVLTGGRLEIKNNSLLERCGDDSIDVDSGGTMLLINGSITTK